MSEVVVVYEPTTIIVETAGARGPTGLTGIQGPSPVYVQDAAPTGTPAAYMWVQTGIGVGGTNFTIWLETGH